MIFDSTISAMIFQASILLLGSACMTDGMPLYPDFASAKRTDTGSTPSTFFLVDNESGLLANANPDPSGVFFGTNYNSPTLFTIDPSTSLLLTADPDQTSFNSYVDTGDFSPVQIGTAASSGFIKCSTVGDELSCSADNTYSQFMLDSISGSSDYQLYLVKAGEASGSARTATMKIRSSSPSPSPIPTKFYLSTTMGYAVDFAPDSGIYAGSNFAKEAAGSVYSLDPNTGYLTTSSSPPSIAYIDQTATTGYAQVQLSPTPLSSDTMTPITCQIATDGSLTLSCQASNYQTLWLNRASSTSGDYTLYLGTPDSTGDGSERVTANVKVSNCSTCT